MPTEVSTTLAEAQIRQLIDEYVNAVKNRDLEAITAPYANDVVFFDAIPPLKYTGVAAYRKNWNDCFDMMEGTIGYEVSDLNINANDELGFAHSVNRLSGTVKKDGKKMDMWFRNTVGFRKAGGKWLITHEHASVPFDPESEKALTDLKP
jgi:ketosteroid isomerase-like protein